MGVKVEAPQVEVGNTLTTERLPAYEAYRKQLEKGAKHCSEILHLAPEDERVKKAHPELLLFFSFVNPESVAELGSPVSCPTLTEYGLEFENKLYGYSEPLLEQILRFRGEQSLRGAQDGEDTYNNLCKGRKAFSEEFKKECGQYFARMIRESNNQAIKELKEAVDANYLQNTPFRFGVQMICSRYPRLSEYGAKRILKAANEYTKSIKKVEEAQSDLDTAQEELKRAQEEQGGVQEKQGKAREDRMKMMNKRIKSLELIVKWMEENASQAKEEYEGTIKYWGVGELDASSLLGEAKSAFQEAKKSFIIENGYVTAEEYSKLENYHAVLKSHYSLINSGDPKKDRAIARRYATVLYAVKVEMGMEYGKNHSDEPDYREIRTVFDFNFSIGKYTPESRIVTVQEARKRLEDKLRKEFGSSDPFNNIDTLVDLAREYLTIKVKYRRGEVKFGPTPPSVMQDYKIKKREMHEEMEKTLDSEVTECVNRVAKDVEKKTAMLALARNDISDAVFVPAGCFVQYLDGNIGAFAITPFDRRINDSLEPYEAELWRKSWDSLRQKAIEQHGKDNPVGLVSYINEKIGRLTDSCRSAVPNKVLDRLQDIQQKYSISVPGLFAPNSEMNHLPTMDDINSLEEIMPDIAKVVHAVDFGYVEMGDRRKMNLEGITTTLEYLLSNRSRAPILTRNTRVNDLVGINNQTITFNLPLYRTILHDTGYDYRKARRLFCSCLGYALFEKLDNNTIQRFASTLDKRRISISSQTLLSLFGVSVYDPIERRTIAMRLYFIDELDKYATGKSSPEMNEFFSSLDVFKNKA